MRLSEKRNRLKLRNIRNLTSRPFVIDCAEEPCHRKTHVLSFSQYMERVKQSENELELYFIMRSFQENQYRFTDSQIFFAKEQFDSRAYEFEKEAVKNRL